MLIFQMQRRLLIYRFRWHWGHSNREQVYCSCHLILRGDVSSSKLYIWTISIFLPSLFCIKIKKQKSYLLLKMVRFSKKVMHFLTLVKEVNNRNFSVTFFCITYIRFFIYYIFSSFISFFLSCVFIFLSLFSFFFCFSFHPYSLLYSSFPSCMIFIYFSFLLSIQVLNEI